MIGHLLRIAPTRRPFIAECSCGGFYVESIGRDAGSEAEMQAAYTEHLEQSKATA
jgi:hypothetical protein